MYELAMQSVVLVRLHMSACVCLRMLCSHSLPTLGGNMTVRMERFRAGAWVWVFA